MKWLDAPGRYFRTRADTSIPRVRLQQQHIQNCQIVLDRRTMLSRLPAGGITAELGVDEGAFSEIILTEVKPETLHLVDVWDMGRYNDAKYQAVTEKFRGNIESGGIKIVRQYSTDAAAGFPDGHFQLVYIDTDHSYETTAEELKLWGPKISEHGIIAGHDYKMGNWKSANRYGVIEAVHEFCVNAGWELVYLTADPTESQSFAIRKIAR
ncbi:hypothetical protein AB833_22900 [Chromatiales bacterium (ex Bugula neritina AB1)]|nr:hypothetical protein AB833_22900 [Chromatiales bacterium (ex Bugula neritina AB1)]